MDVLECSEDGECGESGKLIGLMGGEVVGRFVADSFAGEAKFGVGGEKLNCCGELDVDGVGMFGLMFCWLGGVGLSSLRSRRCLRRSERRGGDGCEGEGERDREGDMGLRFC